jgi:hyaluronan synthase
VSPVYKEDPAVLAWAVESWLAAGADEVTLVMPQAELAAVTATAPPVLFDPRVHVVVVDGHDKRTNLAVGIHAANHPIVVLSDSDTLWEKDLLANLLMPFCDPSVGGVGTRQRVLHASTSVWRRAADWLLDSRYLAYVPAMARVGGVSCLSGRTVAYRRDVVLPLLDDLTAEVFLGTRCVSGDDGRLTWLVLNAGYKAAYQSNAVAWTVMPDSARAFFRQRLRWGRNSFRCYLGAIQRGWLFDQPMITRISVLQGLLAPLSLTVGMTFAGVALAGGHVTMVVAWIAWVTLGRGLRAFDHLREDPRNIVLLPLMTALIVIGLTVVKYHALVTMRRQAWITRSEERAVAEGQAATTLALGGQSG